MSLLSFHSLSNLRILAINGSHRRGNTQFALSTIINTINQSFPIHHGLLINLHEQKIDYCTQHQYTSSILQNQNDDMPKISQLMQMTDVIIFGSPIYFYSVTGRMKTFIDRCNRYRENERLRGKLVYTLGVGGSTRPDQMMNSLSRFYAALRLKNCGYEFFTAEGPNDLQMNSEAVRQLQQLGKKIVDSKFCQDINSAKPYLAQKQTQL